MVFETKKAGSFFEGTTGFHFSRGKPPGLWDRLENSFVPFLFRDRLGHDTRFSRGKLVSLPVPSGRDTRLENLPFLPLFFFLSE